MPLTEIRDGAAASPGRRWFAGTDLELVVWTDAAGIRLYHLRYRRPGGDGVLEWRRGHGLAHHALDDGEGRGGRAKATPVLAPARASDGPPPELAWIRARFQAEGATLDPGVRDHVLDTLDRP